MILTNSVPNPITLNGVTTTVNVPADSQAPVGYLPTSNGESWVGLAPGTNGQVLTVGATGLAWVTPGSTTTTADQGSAFYGQGALISQSTGTNNAAFGSNALAALTTGAANVAFGENALPAMTTGAGNCAFGQQSLQGVTTGQYNVGIGLGAGQLATTANFLVAMGYQAGYGQTTTANGTFIGSYCGKYETAANTVMIDNINRSNLAGGRAGAPFYAVTSSTVASQTVQLNGVVSIPTLPIKLGSNQMTWAALAPTTGTWAVGDICWNTGVTASTSPGWVCTTAGTTGGTWTAMPVL